MTTAINILQAQASNNDRFLLHSELPQPIRFKDIQSNTEEELSTLLQNSIDTYSDVASKFTIDDDNVGRGLVCAFIRDSSAIKGVMLYCKKEKIQEYMTRQGFQCSLDSEVSPVIQCLRI